MELRDGLLGLLGARHGDKGEAAGLAGEFILHEGRLGDGAALGEMILKIHFGGVEGKIPDEEFGVHMWLGQTDYCFFQTVPDCRVSNHH